MKQYTTLAACLAFPMALATAQTTTPPTTPSTSTQPYIPLFGTTSGTNGAASNSTWFIDTTRNLVVACTTPSASSNGGTPTITCSAQAVPTAATGGGAPTPPTGGAANGDGDTSAGVLRNPFSR